MAVASAKYISNGRIKVPQKKSSKLKYGKNRKSRRLIKNP